MKNLNEKVMLVRHIVRKKDFRKFDKQVSEEINNKYKADKNAGRYNKVLIAREALEKINSIASIAYSHHIKNTLPWDDWGSRILPAEHYFDYINEQRGFKGQFDAAVENFINEYPQYIDEARKRLNGMFRISDYPIPESLPEHFGIDIKIRPLPESEDIRVGIGGKEVEKIKAELENDMQAVVKSAIKELWIRLHESLETMHDRLKSYAGDELKRFYSSWLENVEEIVLLIPKLNFTNDPELDEMAENVRKLIADHSKDTLKDNHAQCKKIAGEAEAILKQMASYIGD